MTTEEKYEWILKAAIQNGIHPHIILRDELVTKILNKNEKQTIRGLLIERRSEHAFDVYER